MEEFGAAEQTPESTDCKFPEWLGTYGIAPDVTIGLWEQQADGQGQLVKTWRNADGEILGQTSPDTPW